MVSFREISMTCRTSKYSVYFDGPFYGKFRELYKGVIVNAHVYPEGGHLGIRKHSIKIFGKMFPMDWVMLKRRNEKMYELKFIDSSRTIEIVGERTNPSPSKIKFNKRTYEDLKENIPDFLEDVGFKFETYVSDGLKSLKFLLEDHA